MKVTRNKGDFIALFIGLADINVSLWVAKARVARVSVFGGFLFVVWDETATP
jgi:hypothetical protein